MRIKNLFYILLSTFVLLACAEKQDSEVIVRSLLDQYQNALSSKSSIEIASVFHDNAKLLPEEKDVIEGKESIIDHFKVLENLDFQEQFTINEILEAGEYLIVQTQNDGSWKNVVEGTEGSFSSKGQMVFGQDGKKEWKIFRYAYSSNAPSSNDGPSVIPGDFAHVVLFWLKNPQKDEDRGSFESSLSSFVKKSEFVNSMHIGNPADTDRPIIDKSYTYCLIVTFDSKAEHDNYQKEPVHLQFIDESKDLWKKVLIYDSMNI